MDVRCERCATEYELDDDSVPPGGCPVQCTSCGHTFTVQQPQRVAPTTTNLPSPPPADWLLETSDGMLHRFRNLTSLQKWIIERKVTREDKISRTGQAWRKLGEIVELSPFFDVVDEADRARAVQAGLESDDLKAEALRARKIGSSRAHATVSSKPTGTLLSPPEVADDAEAIAALDAWAADGQAIADAQHDGDLDTSVMSRGRGGKVVALVIVAGLLVVGGILFASKHQAATEAKAPASEPAKAVASAAQPTAPPAAPPAPASESALPPSPPAPDSVAAAPAADPGLPPAAAEVGAAPAAVPEPAPSLKTDDPGASASKASEAGAEAPATYEKIVTDADRLLENGATDKAVRLYERALKLQPAGVDALTGMAYAMLDKERVRLAIGYFERALSQAPSYGPAMFGLAEALRAEGNDARARELYQRYLQVNATGADAPAVRRQLRLLEDKLEKASSSAGSAQDPAAP